MLLLAIFSGGAIGSAARYMMSAAIRRRSSDNFPWPTLSVNVAGCLLLGATLPILTQLSASTEVRGFATVGVLGAFTTFSTFSYETLVLLQGDHPRRAGLYIGGSLVLGLLALAVGAAVTTAIVTRLAG